MTVFTELEEAERRLTKLASLLEPCPARDEYDALLRAVRVQIERHAEITLRDAEN